MRILTVCTSWRVFGAETITLRMLDGFKRNGHALHAVSSIWSDGEMSRRLARLSIADTKMAFGAFSKKLAWRPMLWTAIALVRLPGLWVKFRRTFRRFQPDVLIFTSSKQAVLLYPWVGAKPTFLIEYTNIQPSGSNRKIYGMLARKLSRFVAVSDFMGKHLRLIGAPADKIAVIRSGAFFEAQKPVLASPSLPSSIDCTVVGIVGQIAPNKGHDCLVEAARLLKERALRIDVRVFGGGPDDYTEALKQKINQAGLDPQWHWMGYESDKAKIFGSLDICVVPSCFGDPFPTVAMEAGAYGLPVVASLAGGLPEIIEDTVTGWLIEPNQPAQLASKIEWLVRNPDKARAMGAAGRHRVFKHFTVEKMVAEFEQLFSEHVKPAPTVTC